MCTRFVLKPVVFFLTSFILLAVASVVNLLLTTKGMNKVGLHNGFRLGRNIKVTSGNPVGQHELAKPHEMRLFSHSFDTQKCVQNQKQQLPTSFLF